MNVDIGSACPSSLNIYNQPLNDLNQNQLNHRNFQEKCCFQISNIFKSVINFFKLNKEKKYQSQLAVDFHNQNIQVLNESGCPSTSNLMLTYSAIDLDGSGGYRSEHISTELLDRLNAYLLEISSGILPLHLFSIIKTARETQTIIGIRPVSKHARRWIELGHPTKPFAIKDKTCKTGVAAGLIKDHILNKNISMNAKLNEIEIYARTDIFLFSEADIIYFLQNKHDFSVSDIHFFNSSNHLINCIDTATKIVYETHENKNNNEIVTFECLQKQIDNTWRLFTCDFNGEKTLDEREMFFWRYADKKSLPFTSDYDLLTIGFDKNLNENSKYQSTIRISSSSDLRKFNDSPETYLSNENPTKGNVSPFLESIIRALNLNIKRLNPASRSTFHHNIEARNPMATSDFSALFPAVFTIPDFDPVVLNSINQRLTQNNITPIRDCVFIPHTWEALQVFIEALKVSNSGFDIKIHPIWPVSS